MVKFKVLNSFKSERTIRASIDSDRGLLVVFSTKIRTQLEKNLIAA